MIIYYSQLLILDYLIHNERYYFTILNEVSIPL